MNRTQVPPASPRRRFRVGASATGAFFVLASCSGGAAHTAARPPTRSSTTTAAPATTATPTDPANIYAGTNSERVSPALSGDLTRVYVPDGLSNRVTVIDPTTARVVGSFPAGRQPQHIVPSWDLRTLWVLDNSGGDLIPIDPRTAHPGKRVKVDDPYNLYFTPDGSSAIVVAEARQRLDFRDPHTMRLQSSLPVPGCKGINHADYSTDGTYLLVTCEFAGSVAKIDMLRHQVIGLLQLGTPMSGAESRSTSTARPMSPTTTHTPPAMPQDIRTGPDGRHFYVADMAAGGVHVLDGDSFTVVGFIATGVGTHGITPSRDGHLLYVANRGSTSVTGTPHGPGSVSVVDPASNTVTATWPVPGGGSPDMGNLTADGTRLWLSGRFDSEVYSFDTTTGVLVARIPVGRGPHGLTVWPQPGTYSLGHTGNMR